MKTRILKIAAKGFSLLILIVLFGCTQHTTSSNMDDSMTSMDEPMLEQQQSDIKDSMETMDEMKKEEPMEKSSGQDMGGMDKKMK